jgi:hypothetical protein
MQRILFRILLSVALIFQGMGSACAYGSMSDGKGSQAQSADQSMTDMTTPCAEMNDGDRSGNAQAPHPDCMHLCSMAAGLPIMVLSVPPLLHRDNLAVSPIVSLIELVQIPPTPPPIA